MMALHNHANVLSIILKRAKNASAELEAAVVMTIHARMFNMVPVLRERAYVKKVSLRQIQANVLQVRDEKIMAEMEMGRGLICNFLKHFCRIFRQNNGYQNLEPFLTETQVKLTEEFVGLAFSQLSFRNKIIPGGKIF